MRQSDKVRLHFGPYRSPAVEVGQAVRCAVRGPVTVKGVHKARINWPYHHPRGEKQLVVTGDLERAVRQESTSAVAHWWGVCKWTVSRWRRRLGVPQKNPGTLKSREYLYR